MGTDQLGTRRRSGVDQLDPQRVLAAETGQHRAGVVTEVTALGVYHRDDRHGSSPPAAAIGSTSRNRPSTSPVVNHRQFAEDSMKLRDGDRPAPRIGADTGTDAGGKDEDGGMNQATGRRRVLVVDDERSLAKLVASYLERDGYAVECAFDGAAALDAAQRTEPDVVVLDLMLPEVDGVEVCRQLRTFSNCYVVMLTARTEEVDKLIGLGVGADDYVTKPFSPRELVARVRAMLRRPRIDATGEEPARRFGPLEIDVAAREVRLDGRPVDLTRTEFDVLAALSARPKVAFSRAQLIAAVWGDTWVGDEHLVDVHVGHLRRKLGDDAAAPRFVRTVRGVGYRMGEGS